MPNLSPIQPAFNGGETSGRVRGRVDLDIYKRSLSECLNFRPLAQGSLLMRGGSELSRGLAGAAAEKRLIQFRLTDEQDYFILLGHRTLQVYDSAGTPVDYQTDGGTGGSVANLVSNGTFDDNLSGWVTEGSPLVETLIGGAKWCKLLTVGTRIRQSFSVTATGTYTFRVQDKGLCDVNNGTRVKVGLTNGGSELLDTTLWGVADVLNDPMPALDVPIDVAAGATVWVMFEYVERGPNPLGNVPAIDNVEFISPSAAGGATPAPWSGDDVARVHFSIEPGADRTYFACPGVFPHVLKRVNGVWVFGVATPDQTPWIEGHHPETVGYFAGRTWWAWRNHILASRALNPIRNTDGSLGSVAGGPFDFSLTTEGVALPGDAIDAKAATPGAIRWFCGKRALLLGTDLGEHSITGSRGVPLVGDFQVVDEDGVGSSRTQAVDAGSHALHVSSDRRQVRALAFDDVNKWSSEDVTFLAEHITKARVKEIHFTRTPDGLILSLLDDGTIAACAWEPKAKVVAWWRIGLPGAAIRTMAVSRGPAGAWLWAITERGAASAAFLERIPLHDDESVRYLDFSVAGVLDEDGSFPYGVADDERVRVLVDGKLAGDFAAAGNRVTLGAEYAGMQYVAGFPFRARAVTLPLEGGNPEGTSQGMKVHYTDISARLNNSAAPLLNGERAGEGRPFVKPLEAWELRTEDVKVKSLKVEEGGVITIEQDLPFRTEVCAVYARALVSKV